MPLQLPNLDTRRWSDLVEEGRALIPRYAPAWTDHNIHDPGITLIELLAWLVEQEIYRVNRVPERHRRKFLALAGFAPQPPRPARTPLTFTLNSGAISHMLPAGVTISTGGATPLPFRTRAQLTVVPVQIRAVQVFDGATFTDQTRRWNDGLPFLLLGANPGVAAAAADPASHPAFYLGFDQALPTAVPVTLWLRFAGTRSDEAERARIQAEAQAIIAACRPLRPLATCTPAPLSPDAWCPPAATELDETGESSGTPTLADLLAHHTVRTVWEYFDGIAWQAFDTDHVQDDTRGLTLDGAVQLTVPGIMLQQSVGAIAEPYFYVRVRLASGPPDVAPILTNVNLNTVDAEQATANTALQVGIGSGLPGQQIVLPGAPIANGQVQLEIVTAQGTETWNQRPDLDSSTPINAHFMLDASTGLVTFGDGQNGRVVPAGVPIVASYDTTSGAAGNVPAHSTWQLTDDPINQALLGGELTSLIGDLKSITNRAAAVNGSDAEEVIHAAGRAAESLWAHERVLELATTNRSDTLDQLERATVLALAAPARATTLLDFERLALDVPGTQLSRAKAWAGLDPAYPCLKAPGTVTVVIVPDLPQARPLPTAGLLQAVRRYLDRRRVIGTRLVVVGAQYLEVSVRATVRMKARSDPARVRNDIIKQLNAFLDPLQGGPQSRGWPFGRDVYRAEILQVIDGVAGVDHVLSLELVGGTDEAQCGNLCVGPTWLVTPGQHVVEVKA